MIVYTINTHYNEFSNYCYIIEDESSKTGIIIDPAWDITSFENIIKQNNITPKALLITHSHIDHTNLVDYFVDTYNLDVYISKIEANYYDFRCQNMKHINDNDILTIGSLLISCHLVPGHTKGSMAYSIGNNLFVGDTIFNEGCGLCTYSDESINAMFSSIQTIKKSFSNDIKIYPGHIYYQAVGQTLEILKENNLCFLLNREQFYSYQLNLKKKQLTANIQL